MGCKCKAGSSVGLEGRRVFAVRQKFSAFTPHDLSSDFNTVGFSGRPPLAAGCYNQDLCSFT